MSFKFKFFINDDAYFFLLKISRCQTANLLEIWFLSLGSPKKQKRNKSKFVTKFIL